MKSKNLGLPSSSSKNNNEAVANTMKLLQIMYMQLILLNAIIMSFITATPSKV